MKKLLFLGVFFLLVFACTRKLNAPTPAPSPEAQAALVLEGQTVYTNRCGRCHALKPVGKWEAAEWKGILQSMIPMARLNQQDSTRVTAYVLANAKK